MGQVHGFLRNINFLNIEEGNTIIICDGKMDGDDKAVVTEMAPTKSVIFIMVKYYHPEIVLDFLENQAGEEDLWIFGSNYSGHELSIRLGARIGAVSLGDALNLWIQEDESAGALEKPQLLVEKMVYSNHMKGTYLVKKGSLCICLDKGQEETNRLDVKDHTIEEAELCDRFPEGDCPVMEYAKESDSLVNQKFVILAGRGARNKETTEKMEEIAKDVGAAFGVSRPAATNVWAPMDRLVGVSGAMLKPQICIAAGTSGAPAFYAGIEKSKLIVAINTDDKAPLIKKADAAIIGDCREVLEELKACLNRHGWQSGGDS